MSAFQLQWVVEGQVELSRVLLGMESNLKDYRYPFKQSADYLTHLFAVDVFSTQGAVIGERWQRLSPYTVAQKARHGYPLTPLVRTGKMQNSFQSIVSSDQAVVYNPAEYFRYHQSNQPRSKIPRRVMMRLNEQAKAEIVRFFQEHIRASMANP